MRSTSLCIASLVALGLAGFSADAASSLGWQTYVSGTGKDTGICPVTAPCATFQYAYNHVVAGGSINVLSSGSFGLLSIDKALNIIAPEGVEANIDVPATGTGIDVQTTGLVFLKGLHIVGRSSAENSIGIATNGTGVVTIDHVVVTGTNVGIQIGGGVATIRNCLIVNNEYGIYSYSATYLGQTTVTGNAYGLHGTLNSYGDNITNGNTISDAADTTITEVQHDQ